MEERALLHYIINSILEEKALSVFVSDCPFFRPAGAMGEKRLVSVPQAAGAAGVISLFDGSAYAGGGVLPDRVEVSRINSKQAVFRFRFRCFHFPQMGSSFAAVLIPPEDSSGKVQLFRVGGSVHGSACPGVFLLMCGAADLRKGCAFP